MKTITNTTITYTIFGVVCAMLMFVEVVTIHAAVVIDTGLGGAVSTTYNDDSDGLLEANVNVDAQGNTNQNGSTAATTTTIMVNTAADLEVFKENLVETESDIYAVDSTDSSVTVVFNNKGKLFGLIPASIKSRTVLTTDTEGNFEVKSRLPWWSIFVSKIDHNRANLEAQIKNDAKVKAYLTGGIDAQPKAYLIQEIITQIRMNASTNAKVNASASAQY